MTTNSDASQAVELPPLPDTPYSAWGHDLYPPAEVQAYARAAIAQDRAARAQAEPDDKPDPERRKMERDADSWRTLMVALGVHKRVELTCECMTAPRVLVPRYAYQVTVGPVTARNRATPDAALRSALQSASEGRSV